jgi:hypothetical protein
LAHPAIGVRDAVEDGRERTARSFGVLFANVKDLLLKGERLLESTLIAVEQGEVGEGAEAARGFIAAS